MRQQDQFLLLEAPDITHKHSSPRYAELRGPPRRAAAPVRGRPGDVELGGYLNREQVLSSAMLNTPSSLTLFLWTVPPKTLFII